MNARNCKKHARDWKCFVIFILFGISLMPLTGCKKKDTLVIGGSETLHGTVDYLANAFEKEHPEIGIDVRGGGSQVGIDLLKEGKLDIALSSRDLTEEEFITLSQGTNLEKLTIAYDGVAVVVHPKNPVLKITTSQISDVFSGKIRNWKELGGDDKNITLIIRNDNSGTLRFFRDYALRGRLLGGSIEKEWETRDFAPHVTVNDNLEMAKEISRNEYAIGFMGMGSALVESEGKVKTLMFSKTGQDPFVEPTPKNVWDRKYKLSRAMYVIYRADSRNPFVNDFISFVTSEKGQELILKRGYLRASLPEVEVKAE